MVTLNDDQQLYVIPSGKGFTCLWYDVAFRKAKAIADWLLARRINVIQPDHNNIGTLEGYGDYTRLCQSGSQYNQHSNQRCPAELHSQLIPFEGKRIEVTTENGEKRRFWVGKSTGWMPIHLEIKTRSSIGGDAIRSGEVFTSIRIIK